VPLSLSLSLLKCKKKAYRRVHLLVVVSFFLQRFAPSSTLSLSLEVDFGGVGP
jgi:hypothetical protein